MCAAAIQSPSRAASGQHFLPRRHRLLAIDVKMDSHLRLRQLHRVRVNDIAPQQQRFTRVADTVDHAAGRMTGGGNSINAGHNLHRRTERVELTGIYHRTQRTLRLGESVALPSSTSR